LSGTDYSCVVPIVEGANTILVVATDVAGNISQSSISVQGGVPALLSSLPSNGQQGQQNLSVAIIGQYTHLVQGTTTASLGAGVTVASLTVPSATTATAVLNIDPTAAVGFRGVSLSTGAEVATLANGFSVTPGTPVITQVAPNSGQQGQQSL